MPRGWPCLALVTPWPWDHGLLESTNRGLGPKTGKARPRSVLVASGLSHEVGGSGVPSGHREPGAMDGGLFSQGLNSPATGSLSFSAQPLFLSPPIYSACTMCSALPSTVYRSTPTAPQSAEGLLGAFRR